MNDRDIKQLDVLIDQYLRQEMPLEEMQKFEQLMKEDEELANEVSLRYDIMMGIRAAEQQTILQHLINTPVHKKTSKTSNIPWAWIAIGTGVSLVLAWALYNFL